MLEAFYTADGGLKVDKNWLSVISDNITNVNTVGFKQERVNFEDVISHSITKYSGKGVPKNKELGGGAYVASTIKDFSQGEFKTTNSPLSLALDGEGFFMVKNPSATQLTYYTRAGDFRLDANGNVINPDGYELQGWKLDKNGNIAGAIGAINVPSALNPKSTNTITLKNPANLNASSDTISDKFDPSDSSTYNYVNTITTYDSLGKSHILKHYFQKTGINSWKVFTEMDDRAVLYTDGTYNYASVNLKFNGDGKLISGEYASKIDSSHTHTDDTANEDSSDNGVFSVSSSNTPILPGSVYIKEIDTGSTTTSVNWNDDGSGNIVDIKTGDIVGSISYNDGKITIIGKAGDGSASSLKLDYEDFNDTSTANVADLTKIKTNTIDYSNTQSRYLNTGANAKAVTENFNNLTQLSSDFIFYAKQDGSGKGDLMSVSTTEDGVLKATYTNGEVKNMARLAIATFKDKEMLTRKGNSLYLPNKQTYTPIIIPGGVISKIRSGMLEMSNVDISKEFINLITAQRAYQANAKTITTADQILQTTMNIKR